MNRAQQIIGDGKNRKENDFYATPPYAVQALLDKEQFIGNILEPACGEGHISKVLINNNYKVDSFDLIDRGYGAKQDFLTYTGFCDNILEPACGEGHISKVLINNNYKVDSFDLIDRGYGAKQDFLTYTGFCDNI